MDELRFIRRGNGLKRSAFTVLTPALFGKWKNEKLIEVEMKASRVLWHVFRHLWKCSRNGNNMGFFITMMRTTWSYGALHQSFTSCRLLFITCIHLCCIHWEFYCYSSCTTSNRFPTCNAVSSFCLAFVSGFLQLSIFFLNELIVSGNCSSKSTILARNDSRMHFSKLLPQLRPRAAG